MDRVLINATEAARAIIAHSDANGGVNWVYALRTDYVVKRPGSICRLSRDWDHDRDRPSSRRLPGTCGTRIDADVGWDEYEDVVMAIEGAAKVHSGYPGTHTYIIAGNAYYADNGEDDGEVILSVDTDRTYRDVGIRGAQVVYIVR
jgi:hypothetical protein